MLHYLLAFASFYVFSNLGKINFLVIFSFGTFEVSTQVKANIIDKLQQEMTNDSTRYKTPTFFGKQLNTSFADTSNVVPGQRLVRYIYI